ncbi:hypothetical protein [Kiloniella antarctica]|uniref:Integrase catalytic domain-containing protein n=1 Tax=Kiloniella antarctica TaxID=1550907 RepID=A0ABW5BL55_9PROT
MSFELRTSLNAVLGFTETLVNDNGNSFSGDRMELWLLNYLTGWINTVGKHRGRA